MTNNKGITLIALVITIIVLLILAGVSIAMLTGDNGVLTQANEAKIEDRAGKVDEVVNLWKTEWSIYNETGSNEPINEETMLTQLKNDKLVNENEIHRKNKTISIGKRIINYDMQKNIKKNFKIGDYVDYRYDTSDNYIYNDVENEISFDMQQTSDLKWRILKVNNSTLDLVAENTIQQQLKLMSSYNNTNHILAEYEIILDVLNNICAKHYSNARLGTTARSVKIEDYTEENKIVFEDIKNQFFYATKGKNVMTDMTAFQLGIGIPPIMTTVCYSSSYGNQTWGSTRQAYILPIVTIQISNIGEKENNIWQIL